MNRRGREGLRSAEVVAAAAIWCRKRGFSRLDKRGESKGDSVVRYFRRAGFDRKSRSVRGCYITTYGEPGVRGGRRKRDGREKKGEGSDEEISL